MRLRIWRQLLDHSRRWWRRSTASCALLRRAAHALPSPSSARTREDPCRLAGDPR
ncbi:hypothetical protein ACU4GD_41560 [Cupriavidus basilensis]